MSVLDRVDPIRLAEVAEQVRTSYNITNMPPMRHFNSDPCEEHAGDGPDPNPYCTRCGIKLRRHQRVAIMWLWLAKYGLIADPVGTGKTHVVTGLFSILSETGELSRPRGGGRALVVCEPTAIRQWQREMRRAVPGLITERAEGSRRQREDKYSQPWDVLIIGHQMLLQDGFQLSNLGIHTIIVDDVDPIRHSETQTAGAIKRIGLDNDDCKRVVLLNATPLHKKLMELYDTLSQIGGSKVYRLGPRDAFARRHLIKSPSVYYKWDARANRAVKKTTMEVTGHRYLPEFRERIAPMVLRRSLDEIDDVELPSIQPENVWLELHPAQRERYEELQDGVLDMIRNGAVQRIAVRNKLLVGQQICEGLASIGGDDGPGASVKFDWIMNRLNGDWSPVDDDTPGEKVVVFCQYKNGIRALGQRFQAEGVGYELLWGEERRPKIRDASLERFREDAECRVLLGTSAIEKSLNLQIARHLVNIDQLPNPARMTQLSGRVRRQGSRFHTVYVHNLLTVETHEERALARLELEAGLSSAIWQEEDALYSSLSPLEIATLIAPQARRARRPRTRAAS